MNFTIINGQIYTPGLAIVDSPQPYTPLGGDTLQIAIDVSGNGNLPLNQSDNAKTTFHSITLFLTSAEKEKNFTISNGTSPHSSSSGYVGPILGLEPASTVKHVNWVWPACFVGQGDGDGDGDGGARGEYNVSMHQAFRWNGTEYYTVFDLPVSVSNGIEEGGDRVDCEALENRVEFALSAASNGSLPGRPWVDMGSETATESGSGSGSGSGSANSGSRRAVGVKHWALFALVVGMMVF